MIEFFAMIFGENDTFNCGTSLVISQKKIRIEQKHFVRLSHLSRMWGVCKGCSSNFRNCPARYTTKIMEGKKGQFWFVDYRISNQTDGWP